MSLRPVDESGERERQPSGGGDGSRSTLGRFADRVRLATLSVRVSLRRALDSLVDRDGSDGGPRGGPPVPRDAQSPLGRTDRFSERAADPPACSAVEGLPARDRPLTFPARHAQHDNDTDLVSTTDGERITIELPGEPDAHISSDTWESVDP